MMFVNEIHYVPVDLRGARTANLDRERFQELVKWPVYAGYVSHI